MAGPASPTASRTAIKVLVCIVENAKGRGVLNERVKLGHVRMVNEEEVGVADKEDVRGSYPWRGFETREEGGKGRRKKQIRLELRFYIRLIYKLISKAR
jgi:hypothetical protein